ncbi:MAG: ERAP1-like C-terminal domain-containing protein, partial [Yaniella sp.]|nr:ERAP1-like C-terminal domain-containing protein [Yaniella sp.]
PDTTSLSTLTERLGDIDDSLTRSLLWGAAWDKTRDGEISGSWFLKLILQHIGAETDSSVVFSLLRQATTVLDNFVPSSQGSGYREQFATGIWELAQEAESGSDIQLQLVQAYIRHARHNAVVAQLAEKRGLEGFSVSTDMSWSALQRLVALGEVGESEIDAALAEDDSSTGQLAAVQARAMIPTSDAKAEAWEQISTGDLTNLELRHMVMGFGDVHDPQLLDPYVDKYFDQINQLWADSSFETAETLALGLFPMWAITERTAQRTISVAETTSYTGLERILTELHDDVRRALTAQATF